MKKSWVLVLLAIIFSGQIALGGTGGLGDGNSTAVESIVLSTHSQDTTPIIDNTVTMPSKTNYITIDFQALSKAAKAYADAKQLISEAASGQNPTTQMSLDNAKAYVKRYESDMLNNPDSFGHILGQGNWTGDTRYAAPYGADQQLTIDALRSSSSEAEFATTIRNAYASEFDPGHEYALDQKDKNLDYSSPSTSNVSPDNLINLMWEIMNNLVDKNLGVDFNDWSGHTQTFGNQVQDVKETTSSSSVNSQATTQDGSLGLTTTGGTAIYTVDLSQSQNQSSSDHVKETITPVDYVINVNF